MNRDNLLKLATYLLSGNLKADFDMSVYTCGDHFQSSTPLSMRTTCGTVGCAVGHGPYAGIPKKSAEDWQTYGYRAFGVLPLSPEFNWMFSADWANTDNTPEGAARRILYTLRKGVPDDAYAQMYGFTELCYLKEKL